MAQALLSEAATGDSLRDVLDNLTQAAEIVLQTKSNNGELIAELLPVFTGFRASPFPPVRTALLDILDAVCKQDLVRFFPSVAPVLEAFIDDPSPLVFRRVVQSGAAMYRRALTHVWLCPPQSPSEPWAEAWASLQRLKEKIVNSLEPFAIAQPAAALLQLRIMKFIQMLALSFSDDASQDTDDAIGNSLQDDGADDADQLSGRFRLDAIPAFHPVLSRTGLKAEGERFAMKLVTALENDRVVSSPPGLIVLIHLVAELGRRRTCFLPVVVDTLLTVHSNKTRLLQSMSRAQVRSIEYAIRATLIAMLSVPGVARTWGEPFIDALAQVGAEDAARRIFRRQVAQFDIEPDRKRSRSEDPSATAGFAAKRLSMGRDQDVDTTFLSRFMGSNGLGPLQMMPSSSQTPSVIVHFLINNMTNLPPPPSALRARLAAREAALLSTDPRLEALQRAQQQLQNEGQGRRREGTQSMLATEALRSKLIVPKLAIDPASITTTSSLALGVSSFSRVIKAYLPLSNLGQSNLWAALVSHLAPFWSLEHSVTSLLIDTLVQHYPRSIPAINTWLTQEFIASKTNKPLKQESQSDRNQNQLSDDDDGGAEPGVPNRYASILVLLLRKIHPHIDPRSNHFKTMVLGLPQLPDSVFCLIASLCREYARVSVGLQTLTDLITHRPASAQPALLCMLEQASQEDLQLRTACVRQLDQLYGSLGELSKSVEESALMSLKQLASSPELSAAVAANDAKLIESISSRHLQLFLTLCRINPSLLLVLCSTYAVVSSPLICRVIRLQLTDILPKFPHDDPIWIEILRSFPDGSKMLVLHMLHVLFSRQLPPPQIVDFIKQNRSDDPHFLLPILPALERSELVAFLPLIISKLGRPAVKTALDRLLNPSLSS
ncbi:MAG: ARM/HEAT domain-containing protein, partial [archaeon]|nr:ARM/HEAT domain-containing protein [archaeon]